MGEYISTRNKKSQPRKFLAGMSRDEESRVTSGMARKSKPKELTIRLREWLTEFELGPTEAADIAGCDQSYISNIASGRKPNINVQYLVRLTDHLGITVNDLYRSPPPASATEVFTDLSPQAVETLLARRRRA